MATRACGCGGGGAAAAATQTAGSTPAVVSLAQASGPAAGGTSVTITGANFVSGDTVMFGSTAAVSVQFVNATTLVAVTPAEAAGAVTVEVIAPGGELGSLAGGFTYAPNPPAVASMEPTSGQPAGGTPVTITGANFVSGATVMFGSTAATTVQFVNSTTLVAITPAEAAGAVTVEVKNPDGTSGSDANGYAFAVPPGVNPTAPTLPQAGYNTQADVGEPSATAMAGYTQVAIPDSGNAITNAAALQAAINAVPSGTCDTEITLPPGAKFEPASGSIDFPAKSCPAGAWIVVRSAAPDASLPAAGVRITPSALPELPVILEGQVNPSPIQVEASANNYLIEFLDLTVDTTALSGKDSSGSMIAIGDGTYGALCTVCNAGEQPTNVVVDRDLMEGSENPPIEFRRGVSLACQRCAVINSYIDQFHETGFDSQAIAGWNSTGPWLIDNNYLSAAGENFISGGAPSNMSQNTSDITFTHNYDYKPEAWDPSSSSFAGTTWEVKNLLELKSAVRVLIEGNIFQNCWTAAQSGRAIALNTTDGGVTANPWTTVRDVTIAYNWADNTQGFGEVASFTSGVMAASATQTVSVHDNLATDQGPGAGWLFLGGADDEDGLAGNTQNVLVDHNTFVLSPTNPRQPSSGMAFEGIEGAGEVPFQNWAIDNNIFEVGKYGVSNNCSVAGVSAPCFNANAWMANLVYDTSTGGSVDWCSTTSPLTLYAANAAACPVANFAAIGFSDGSGNFSQVSDYELSAGSPGYRKGTDGADVGVNIPLLMAAIAGVAP
jgi:hypothetical protein